MGGNRSPSPDPVYDSKGIRTNTREQRTKEKLENRRKELIKILTELDPNYRV